ncbi:PREDICTED: non-secretory ribonuclease [Dipodomys ordii]|uniref:Non-secretory ribonuclease n=1 Tax=Dipodomys ordii TaxID=10020 RepID=A0A1S3G8I3_DIPOR|nr:PREDICTED: non-secretory ribonuclease [Dipodomys ordii]
MGPRLLISGAGLLLLVVGLMGMLPSSELRPPGFTPTMWFDTQHVNMSHPQCNPSMQVINSLTRFCKNKNTFLHTTYVNVVNVCGSPNIQCSSSTQNNCHDSPHQVDITVCDLIGPRAVYPNCNYHQTQATKYYTVACNPKSPQDTVPFPMVPVHLDKTF